MTRRGNEERPFQGGAQPVAEHRAEIPGGGRTAGQVVAFVIAALVAIASVLWLVVPFGG